MADQAVQPLSEALGLPDVFPHHPGCIEEQLTPDALLNGHCHNESATLGLTPERELALTLAGCSTTSLATWRKGLRQQLQGPARHLAAKRKAHVLYDRPLGGGSGSIPLSQFAPPQFPQHSSRGAVSKEAAEAWVRQQLAAPDAPPLHALGWGSGSSDAGQVPHGLPRSRLIELLAELAPPLPRALWFLRVTALNRTRPAGWDGASDAQLRCKQLTEDVLAFLEAAAAESTAATAAAGAPANANARAQPQPAGHAVPPPQQQGDGKLGGDAAAAADRGPSSAAIMPAAWQYGVRLAGHCCSAGLLDAARCAGWAASSRLLLPLPAEARRQVLALLRQCLRVAQLAQQQAAALLAQCVQAAEAAGAAGQRALRPAKHQHQQQKPQQSGQHQQQHLATQRAASDDLPELRHGLLQAAALLLMLHPSAFVAAEERLLLPLLCWRPPLTDSRAASDSWEQWSLDGCKVQQCMEWVASARQQLSLGLHARVLHWHDGKAMQLLDEQLLAGASAAAAVAALQKLVLQQPAAAVAGDAVAAALSQCVRLVCEWAAAAPAADFGAAFAAAAALLAPNAAQPGGAAALLPERVLFGLAMLQAQAQAAQQQAQQRISSAAGFSGTALPPPVLQAALHSWLGACAGEQAQPQWRQQRLLHLTLVLAEAGLLCPAAYLRSCLASGAFQPASNAAAAAGAADGSQPAAAAGAADGSQQAFAAQPVSGGSAGSSCDGSSSSSSSAFHLMLLQQLHPMLDFPSLAAIAGGASGHVGSSGSGRAQLWAVSRLQYAAARGAVLAQYSAVDGAQAPAADDALTGPAAAPADDMDWEGMLAAANTTGGGSSSSSTSTSTGGAFDWGSMCAGVQGHQQLQWHDRRLEDLQAQLLGVLGLVHHAALPSPASQAANASSSAGPAAFGELLQQVRQLAPWQQRHTAAALLAAAKGFLAGTDTSSSGGSGGGGASRSSPPAAMADATSGDPSSAAPSTTPGPAWLLQLLALLGACCGHREALSALATCLNLLQRAVAAAMRSATGTSSANTAAGSPAQRQQQLAAALTAAQRGWEQRTLVPPPLLLALLSGYVASLAASGIAAKLLPMLTGGLWRLQQLPLQQQQEVRRCLEGQLGLAAQLLALPGGDSQQQWLSKMRQQHGGAHWALALLEQEAAACKAHTTNGSQQQQAAAALQAFVRRVQCVAAPAAAPAARKGAAGGGPLQPPPLALFEAPAASIGDGDTAAAPAPTAAAAAAFAAMQHSLLPAALPALLQLYQQQPGGPCLLHQLLSTGPAVAQALLANPEQMCSALQQQQQRSSLSAGSGSSGTQPWQQALALFVSSLSGGCAEGRGSQALLALGWADAMAAAVAAATPATCRCCWAVLRLLLDEQQRQGGHRLAEAERQLARRAVQQAVLRPEAAAALAATLCSLSLAAGQQLLLEIEALLRPPLVALAPQPAWTQDSAAAVAPAPHPVPPPPLPPPQPFAAEQGLVDAALVCLSSGSSAERQHAFAHQLVKQLEGVADLILSQQQNQHQQHQQQHRQHIGRQAHTAQASPAAMQASVWLRLALLLPLLPLAYKQRSADHGGGLRGQLARCMLRLLAAPALRADVQAASPGDGAGVAAAAAAAGAMAGEPLPQRLINLLRALLIGGWASWMRLEGSKLREVPPYEHSRELAADAAALAFPPALRAALTAALPLAQQQGLLALPMCLAGAGINTTGGGALVLDPWPLLEGSRALTPASAAAAAASPGLAIPPWLGGAVKRRRRDLAYLPPPAARSWG